MKSLTEKIEIARGKVVLAVLFGGLAGAVITYMFMLLGLTS